MRPIARLFLLTFLLLPCACALTPRYPPEPKPPKEPVRGAIAEFRLISYDTSRFSARVLIGATMDTLVIDGRLVENSDVELEKTRACGTTELREHYVIDSLFYPRPNEIVTLRKGYWHGSDVYFILWDKETGLGPDCFEADLVLKVLDGRIAVTLPIKVVRTDKPETAPAGSTEALKTSAPER